MSEARKTLSLRCEMILDPSRPAGTYRTDLKVENLAAASHAYRAWITFTGIGASGLARGSGEVRDSGGRHAARISYNGRVWAVDGKGNDIFREILVG